MEAFLRPGREIRNWTERSNLFAWGVVPTAKDEISVYYTQHYRHPSSHLERGVLRVDGFVSVNATYEGGELITRPLVFTGEAGGRCDVDYFTFEHVGGPLRVGLTAGDGSCAEPSLQVELLQGETSAALERLGAGDPGCGGLALDAPAGELHLRVRAAETAPGLTYRVALE